MEHAVQRARVADLGTFDLPLSALYAGLPPMWLHTSLQRRHRNGQATLLRRGGWVRLFLYTRT
jgi:hypothetical protein